MVRRWTCYVPTVDHNRYDAEHEKVPSYAATALADPNNYTRSLATARKAWKAEYGSPWVLDAAPFENTREPDWFVKADMTP